MLYGATPSKARASCRLTVVLGLPVSRSAGDCGRLKPFRDEGRHALPQSGRGAGLDRHVASTRPRIDADGGGVCGDGDGGA